MSKPKWDCMYCGRAAPDEFQACEKCEDILDLPGVRSWADRILHHQHELSYQEGFEDGAGTGEGDCDIPGPEAIH